MFFKTDLSARFRLTKHKDCAKIQSKNSYDAN